MSALFIIGLATVLASLLWAWSVDIISNETFENSIFLIILIPVIIGLVRLFVPLIEIQILY